VDVLGDEGGKAGTLVRAVTTEKGGGEGLLEQARVDRHTEGKAELVELVLDLVERLLPEVAVLSISASLFMASWPTVVMFALLRQLAARTDSSISFTLMLRSFLSSAFSSLWVSGRSSMRMALSS
jgi:hypothetical protein